MDGITPDDIYTLYLLHPREGAVTRTAAGRFMLHNGRIHVLEDHFGIVADLVDAGVGQVTPEVQHRLATLKSSAYYDLVSDGQVERGERPDHVPVADLGEPVHPDDLDEAPSTPASTPKPVWEYHRQGLQSSQVIERKGDAMLMNGQKLSQAEIASILENVRKGTATLTYKDEE